MPDNEQKVTVTVTFRLTPEEHRRFKAVVAQMQQRETLGKVTVKHAFLQGLRLTEKWLEELRRPR